MKTMDTETAETAATTTVKSIKSMETRTTTRTNADSGTDEPVWTRLNHKGIWHDNRRLLKHRARNCECHICYRELYKLPPMETREEYVASIKRKVEERDIKRAKRRAKKEAKSGTQTTMENFFNKQGIVKCHSSDDDGSQEISSYKG